MTPPEVLRAARRLIDTPDKWLQGEWMRSGCYCLWGAVYAVRGEDVGGFPEWKAIQRIEPKPIHFNDAPTTTHVDVLSLLDRAIAELEMAP